LKVQVVIQGLTVYYQAIKLTEGAEENQLIPVGDFQQNRCHQRIAGNAGARVARMPGLTEQLCADSIRASPATGIPSG
jgi:hypothetical protein